MKKLSLIIVSLVIAATTLLTSCDDASVASHNLSKEADYFNLVRRVVFYNGITDSYMLTIEGRCSIKSDNRDEQLEVTCKTGPDSYKKHFLGISDNVTYFVEQLDSADVSKDHYLIVFKPSAIVPSIRVR